MAAALLAAYPAAADDPPDAHCSNAEVALLARLPRLLLPQAQLVAQLEAHADGHGAAPSVPPAAAAAVSAKPGALPMDAAAVTELQRLPVGEKLARQ